MKVYQHETENESISKKLFNYFADNPKEDTDDIEKLNNKKNYNTIDGSSKKNKSNSKNKSSGYSNTNTTLENLIQKENSKFIIKLR